VTLLRIRTLGWDGRADRCAVEADHVHNVPELLGSFSIDLLEHCWNVSRRSYVEQSTQEDVVGFRQAWQTLAGALP